MSEANKARALEFIAAMSAADAAGQARLLAPDAFTVTHGQAGVSGTRTRDTMLATVDAFRAIVPGGFDPAIRRVIAEGDAVVVEWEGAAVLANGVPYANQYVFIFTFADGLIVRLDEYFCTALADRTILPLLAEAGEALAHGDG